MVSFQFEFEAMHGREDYTIPSFHIIRKAKYESSLFHLAFRAQILVSVASYNTVIVPPVRLKRVNASFCIVCVAHDDELV